MQSAVMAILKAKTDKDCEFSTYIKSLKSRPNVIKYLAGPVFAANKFPVNQAQCDHLQGWSCFSHEVFGFPPNICCNHLTCTHHFLLFRMAPDFLFDQVLQRLDIIMCIISRDSMPARSTMCSTSRLPV